MDKIQLSKLLDNYVKGICTPDEIAIINKWYDQYEGDLPDYVSTLSNDERESLKRKMFAKIMVDEVTVPENQDAPAKVFLIGRRWWFAAAAAAIILVVAKFFVFNPRIVAITINQQLSYDIKFVNSTNTIAKQVLPDSSSVWLAPHSWLAYPKHFGAASRNVAMKGECFFEVTKSPKHPFIINSDHLVTRVWGTSFRVTDYGNATATVVVVTGKVSVSKKGSKNSVETALAAGEVLLHPKEEAVYHADKGILAQTTQVDMSSLNMWHHVDLSFDNTRLRDIVNVLNKKFDASISIRDKALGNAVMNADLTDLNLPDVLEVLKVSLKLNYEVTGNGIVLMKTN